MATHAVTDSLNSPTNPQTLREAIHDAHLKESLQPNLPIRPLSPADTAADAPTHVLSSDLDQNDAVLGCDFRGVIKEAMRLAELDSWEVRLVCPDGKKRTVKQIIRQFNRSGYEGSAHFDFAMARAR